MLNAEEHFRREWQRTGEEFFLRHLKTRSLNGVRVRVVGTDPWDAPSMVERRKHVLILEGEKKGQTIRVLPRNMCPESSRDDYAKSALFPELPELPRDWIIDACEKELARVPQDEVLSQRPDCVERVKWLRNEALPALKDPSKNVPTWPCQGAGKAESDPSIGMMLSGRVPCTKEKDADVHLLHLGDLLPRDLISGHEDSVTKEEADNVQRANLRMRVREFLVSGFCHVCQYVVFEAELPH